MNPKKLFLLTAQLSILYSQKMLATIHPRKAKFIKEFAQYDSECHSFIAIFASYLKEPDRSATAFLQTLKRRGAFIIFTSNHPNPRTDCIPEDLVDVFIDNNGFGRDIGQFKTATIFLQKKLRNNIPQKIIYSNDSVFYIDRGDESFLDALLDNNHDFVGTFENPGRESGRAPWFISSWLFSVSDGLFKSKSFVDFFRNYKPINNKNHAVRGGEILITKAALAYSRKIKAIYSNKLLLELLRKYSKMNGPEAAANILPKPIQDEYEEKFHLTATSDHFIEYVGRNAYRFSPTHVFLLLLLSETSFPFIKKDLFWSGGVLYDQLSDLDKILARFCNDHALQEIRAYFRLRGKPTDAALTTRIEIALGLK